MEYTVTERSGQAIQHAIDTAAAAGGGRVLLTPGVYPSGTLYLKSNIELHLQSGAKIVGMTDPDQYDDFCDPGFDAVAPEGSRKCLIACKHAENVSITGCGTIDGAGPAFYDTNVPEGDFFAKPPTPRPRMLQCFNCRNLRIEGVTLLDSPGWTCWLIACEDVQIRGIRIEGCQQMINNDGIDIDSCRRVSISDSFFRTGDDCLILRAIRRTPDAPSICEEVVVSNCVLDSRCQGIRIGCPSDDTIRHCSFSGIVICGKGSGIHFENPHRYLRETCQGYLNAHDLTFHNFDVESGKYPIRINVEDGICLRGISGICFSDFRIRAKQPIYLAGNAGTMLDHVVLRNVSAQIECDTPLYTRYAKNLRLENCDLTATVGEPVPFERKASASWESRF